MKATTMQRSVAWVGVAAAAVLALSPVLVSAATDSANTTVNANINDNISVTSSGTVNINLIPDGAGVFSSASDTVTVETNADSYSLTLADADANQNLVNGGDVITPTSGTFASPLAGGSLANNTWGYRVDGAGTFGAGPTSAQTNAATANQSWAQVPATGSPDTIKSGSGPVASDQTTVWYGVKADNSLPTGTYSDVVVYTASTP